MTALYFDHNVKGKVARILASQGQTACTARDVGMWRATDEEHLLFAATQGWLLVTNDRDFILLHDAWHRWSREWNVHPVHAGILLTVQSWSTQVLVTNVASFLAAGPPTDNLLYTWEPQGWTRYPRYP